jgi:ATP-dependent helicase/nuclease subunit A
MTRASERLVVCGADGERRRPEGCWWNLVANALAPLSSEELAEDGEGKVWRYRKAAPVSGATSAAGALRQPVAPHPRPRPVWLDRDTEATPAAAIPLSPSHAFDAAAAKRPSATSSGRSREKAIARGILMHRLLQVLPDLPEGARRAAAQRHLTRRASGFTAEECAGMIAQICGLLEDARFAQFFAPGSRAELPLVARFAQGGRMIAVSGQVDRLAITPDAVLIADFKTNAPAPRGLENAPIAYIGQLALYRAALRRLYPEKAVRAALIWTEIPDLMEIPAAMMDEALHGITCA